MTIPPNVRVKVYTLRALALALSAFAAVVFLLRPHAFGLRTLALLGIFVGLWLVRRSNAYVWRPQGQALGEWSPDNATRRVEPTAWIVMAASFLACGAAYFLMYLDALHGGKEAWPAYAFGAAALVFAAASGYVVMKLFQ
jgi:FtsH-binding integral membrane protein